MGMHADTYYYAGGFDDWFLDCDSDMTAADLAEYFLSSLCANAGDMSKNVDGLTEPGAVTLRATDGVYPESGQLTTIPASCALSGSGSQADPYLIQNEWDLAYLSWTIYTKNPGTGLNPAPVLFFCIIFRNTQRTITQLSSLFRQG